MAMTTDPASELAEVAERLTLGSSLSGERFLAEQFGVEPWSTGFVKIIACIFERADLIAHIVQRSAMDAKHKDSAIGDLKQFKSGFAGPSLRQHWNTSGHGLSLMKDHGRPIQYLAQTVRGEVSYPKFDEEEIAEFLYLIDAYLKELEASKEGPDFIRQAIFDGLVSFRFQLEHIGWLGGGYALTAFREVMFVYEVSRREFAAADLNPGAVLTGFAGILKKFKVAVDTAQGWANAGSAAWKAYQLASSFAAPLLLSGALSPAG